MTLYVAYSGPAAPNDYWSYWDMLIKYSRNKYYIYSMTFRSRKIYLFSKKSKKDDKQIFMPISRDKLQDNQ
jgi:hypothetical protein